MSDLLRKQLQDSLAIDTRTIEGRLRGLIAQRDRFEAQLRDIDAAIADESRAWADAHRITLRPTLPQMRRHLAATARPKR